MSNPEETTEKAAEQVPSGVAAAEALPDWLENELPTPAIRLIMALNICLYAGMLFASVWDLTVTAPGASPLSVLIAFTSDTLLSFGANSSPATIVDQQYWRLLTNTFIHASFLHLAMNMYVLWDFTRMVERIYGSIKFLTIYLCAAIGSSICSLLFISPDNVSAGASGAIFGAFGALVTYFCAFRKEIPKKFFRMYAKMFFVFAVYTVVSGFVFPGMDNAAHLGGFMAGLWTGLCLLPKHPGDRWVRRKNLLQLACVIALLGAGLFLDIRTNAKNPQVIGEDIYRHATQLLKQDRIPEGIAMLMQAARLRPQNASIYADAAKAYEKIKEYEKSCQMASTALDIDPKSRAALRARALSLHDMGKEQEAIEDYTRLIALDHNSSAIVFNNRAWCYDTCGMPDKALEDTNKALTIDPRCASAYDTRGVAYILLKDYSKAQKDFDSYIALKTDDGAAYYHRALANQLMGNTEAAKADLAQAKTKSYKLEVWERKLLAPVLQ